MQITCKSHGAHLSKDVTALLYLQLLIPQMCQGLEGTWNSLSLLCTQSRTKPPQLCLPPLQLSLMSND